jgi:hypothetical protein
MISVLFLVSYMPVGSDVPHEVRSKDGGRATSDGHGFISPLTPTRACKWLGSGTVFDHPILAAPLQLVAAVRDLLYGPYPPSEWPVTRICILFPIFCIQLFLKPGRQNRRTIYKSFLRHCHPLLRAMCLHAVISNEGVQINHSSSLQPNLRKTKTVIFP